MVGRLYGGCCGPAVQQHFCATIKRRKAIPVVGGIVDRL
jgi:hypothetical protein